MIIKLKGANFSSNNINSLLNSWLISIKNGNCVTAADNISSVEKGESYNNTFTIKENFEVTGVVVTMGGEVLPNVTSNNGNQITINISSVTGAVSIAFTYNYNGGTVEPEDPDTPTTTTWYIDDATQLSNNGVNLSAGSGLGINVGAFSYKETQNDLLVGKQINTVQLRVHTAGQFTFYRYNTSTKTMTELQSFTLENPSTTLQTYTFTTPFTLAEGEFLAFGSTSDVGKPYYYYNIDFNGSDTYSCYYKISNGAAQQSLGSTISFGMNIGYIA